MIIPDYYIKSIKVQNVVTYAFGEYSEGGGGYAFWAAGKGGWYEFDSVAPTYAATYEQMKEALWLLYLCVEGVTSSHIKKPNWTKGEVSKNMQSFFKRVGLKLFGFPTILLDIPADSRISERPNSFCRR